LLYLFQDEMNEIHEREDQAASEAQAAGIRKTHDDLMRTANLDDVESLADDMVGLSCRSVLNICILVQLAFAFTYWQEEELYGLIPRNTSPSQQVVS